MLPTSRELINYIKRKTEILSREVLDVITMKMFSSFSKGIVVSVCLEGFDACSEEEMKDIILKTEKELMEHGYSVTTKFLIMDTYKHITYNINIKE
jgi:hypothetical protein